MTHSLAPAEADCTHPEPPACNWMGNGVLCGQLARYEAVTGCSCHEQPWADYPRALYCVDHAAYVRWLLACGNELMCVGWLHPTLGIRTIRQAAV